MKFKVGDWIQQYEFDGYVLYEILDFYEHKYTKVNILKSTSSQWEKGFQKKWFIYDGIHSAHTGAKLMNHLKSPLYKALKGEQ